MRFTNFHKFQNDKIFNFFLKKISFHKISKFSIQIIILKNDKIIIAYLENYLCNSQNIEANM